PTAPRSALLPYTTLFRSATASSGLPVSLTIDPAASSICTISGSTVSFTAAGTCTIDANQAGNASYQPAPQAQQSFSVGRALPWLTTTSDPDAADTHDPPDTGVPTETSGLPVTFSADPSSAGVCTVSGDTVSFSERGDCTINADQAGDSSWWPAPRAQQTFRVKNHTPG